MAECWHLVIGMEPSDFGRFRPASSLAHSMDILSPFIALPLTRMVHYLHLEVLTPLSESGISLMALKFPLPTLNIQNEIIGEIGLMRQKARLIQNKARKNLSNAASEVEKMILGVKSVEDF